MGGPYGALGGMPIGGGGGIPGGGGARAWADPGGAGGGGTMPGGAGGMGICGIPVEEKITRMLRQTYGAINHNILHFSIHKTSISVMFPT